MRLDPSIDPVQLVHRLCSEAHAHPETKKSRWIKRMHPVTSIRKTMSVDLTAFAKEILKPHFHSGGPPKTVSLRAPPYPSPPLFEPLAVGDPTDLGNDPIIYLAVRGNILWALLICHLLSTLFGRLCEATRSSTETLLLKLSLMLLDRNIR